MALEFDSPFDTFKSTIANDYNAIKQVPEHLRTDEFYIKMMVEIDSDIFSYIENPSELVCSNAVCLDGRLLRLVNNPTNKIIMQALNQNGLALKFVENPTDLMIKTAVMQNGYALQYIDNPTEEQSKLAIQSNGRALRFVKEQTSDLVKTSLSTSYLASLQYVTMPIDNDLAEFIVTLGYSNAHIMKIPIELWTSELRKKAIESCPRIIEYIPNRTERDLVQAMTIDGELLGSIPESERTKRVCKAAIKSYSEALALIPLEHLDTNICRTALRGNPELLCYVPAEFQHEEVLLKILKGRSYLNRFISNQEFLEKYPEYSI